jgi:hypothetical protein
VQKVFASHSRQRGTATPAAAPADGIAVVAKPSRGRTVAVEHFPLKGGPRIEATPLRASPLVPTAPPDVVDPALVALRTGKHLPNVPSSRNRYADEAECPAASFAAVSCSTATMSVSNRPVHFSPTPASQPLSPPNAPPKGGDGAFVF